MKDRWKPEEVVSFNDPQVHEATLTLARFFVGMSQMHSYLEHP